MRVHSLLSGAAWSWPVAGGSGPAAAALSAAGSWIPPVPDTLDQGQAALHSTCSPGHLLSYTASCQCDASPSSGEAPLCSLLQRSAPIVGNALGSRRVFLTSLLGPPSPCWLIQRAAAGPCAALWQRERYSSSTRSRARAACLRKKSCMRWTGSTSWPQGGAACCP